MTLTQTALTAEFLLGGADHLLNRDVVVLAAGQNLEAGTVLGQITVGEAAVPAPFAGNTGDGVVGEIAISAGAQFGMYKLILLDPETDAGAFQLEAPDGRTVGTGKVGVEFDAGGLTFTLADGDTDFEAGDGFDIAVAAGSGMWTQFNQDADDGSQIAAGILFDAVDASAAAANALAVRRRAEVLGSKLIWPSDIEADEKAAGIAQLASIGLVVR